MSLLLENIEQLLTMEPLSKEERGHSVQNSDLGIKSNAWLFCDKGKVVQSGEGKVPNEIANRARNWKNLIGHIVMPGFVDSHTHAMFGGSRHKEFVQRLDGASYQEIAEAGGGIQSTVKATRKASDEQLCASTLKHLKDFLRMGVTTCEIKTGYGLSIEEELRMARLLKSLEDQTPMTMVRTCLALHAIPSDMKRGDYIERVEKELLPQLAEESLVSYVDAFIEEGYFSAKELESLFQTAKDLSLGIRIHADEFTNCEGAQTAARWGAQSADHLQMANIQDAQALAKAGTVATILPGTSLYTGIPFTNAKTFLDAGCAVAVASDFNPGSSYLKNLAQLAVIASIHCHMKSSQVLAGITYVPSLSLGLKNKGSLAPGADADFLIYEMSSYHEWLGNMGQIPPKSVWIASEKP